MRTYRAIYSGADDGLLLEVDDGYGHGTLRNWAAFTQTVAMLCAEAGRDQLDADVVANARALLGGGLN